MLHHVEIYVSDLQRSLEFWGWFLERLGYSKFQTWKSGASWKLGNTYLVFVQTEARFLDVIFHRKRVGLNHLAFHASSLSEIEELRDELKNRGVKILYEDAPKSSEKNHAIYFEDPDRIKVEIVFTPPAE
jgi:catechol 2,3-dioxygenase-like lactoylglutathione lyase family enzyme